MRDIRCLFSFDPHIVRGLQPGRVSAWSVSLASVTWADLESRDCQVCGGYPDAMARCAQLLDERVDVDFVDINSGCPIDLICNKCGHKLLPTLLMP